MIVSRIDEGKSVKAVKKLQEIVFESQTEQFDSTLNKKLTYLLEHFIQSDIVTLFMYDEKSHMLHEKLYYDRATNVLQHLNEGNTSLSMVNPQGCIGKVFLMKTSAIYNYVVSDKDYVESYDNIHGHKLKSQMLMPIMQEDNIEGIVVFSTVIHGNLHRYSQNELAMLQAAEPYFLSIIKKLSNSAFKEKENTDNKEEQLNNNVALNIEKQDPVNDDNMLLFFSNTVHDIRTPANSLYGFLELLEDKLEDKRLKEFVTNAKESAAFINTLTTSILDTAKNRYTSTLSKKEIIVPTKFFSDITNTFSAKILEKKIHYFIYISPDIPKEIQIDSMKLQRVLINLIGNAYKFTPKREEIHVNIIWNASKKSIRCSVRDTGIGIAEKDQKKLFKAFAQATEDTHDKYGGTGLGLALSAGYVADLGGELKLKSKLDEGSEFYFKIPVEVVDVAPKYVPFYDFNKKIGIITEFTTAKYPAFIRKYLMDFGMPKEKIYISDVVVEDTTHVICFEEKITSDLIEKGKTNQIKLLLIEQRLFSLLHKKEFDGVPITSKNVYNADAIYTTVYSGDKVKVLIVDDNRINISLLEAMLESSFVEIDACEEGETALKYLKNASQQKHPYDVIYLDKHMPVVSGTTLLKEFRTYEKKQGLKPIYAVSISGDPIVTEEEKALFDIMVTKPFNKEEVRNIIQLVKE